MQKDNKLGDSKGIVDVAGNDFAIGKKEILCVDTQTGARCQIVEYTSDRGMSYEEALEKYNYATGAGTPTAWLVSKNAPFGWQGTDFRQVALAVGLAASSTYNGKSRFFKISKPSTGTQQAKVHKDDLHDKFSIMKGQKRMDEVKRQWKHQYKEFEHKCMHKTCSNPTCAYAARKSKRFVLVVRHTPCLFCYVCTCILECRSTAAGFGCVLLATLPCYRRAPLTRRPWCFLYGRAQGAMLSMWDIITNEMKNARQDSKMKIVRIQFDDERLVGA